MLWPNSRVILRPYWRLHVGKHLIGDVTAEDEDLPVSVPENALAVVLGETGVHRKPFPVVGENADVERIENQLGFAEPHRLMGVCPKFANDEELGTAIVEI